MTEIFGMIELHTLSLVMGFILDLIIGDPHCLPHPIRAIGALIAGLEKLLYKKEYETSTETDRLNEDISQNNRRLLIRGMWLVMLVVLATALVTGAVLTLAYSIGDIAGFLVESVMCYQILATKSLKQESMKVYYALKNEGLESARHAVSMIVGRDTSVLDRTGVIKAAVETVAENTSDGVIAPLIYMMIGGPVLGMTYKAINTMDSMVGYKNDRYMYYGRAAARLDDIVNYIPSRISAQLMIIATALCQQLNDFAKQSGCYNARNAIRIYRRDRLKHSSPNAAHTEAVCAGALGLQLAGPAQYFGRVVSKPYIGDELRPIEACDIIRVNRLMYVTAFVGLLLAVAVRIAVMQLLG